MGYPRHRLFLFGVTMAFEIERKFLVVSDAWREQAQPVLYRQGYIGTGGVRVRIAGDKAYLTIKSKPLPDAPNSRLEFEYAIPLSDAQQMLDMVCGQGQIEKTRSRISYAGHVWEIDEFMGANKGLIVAEIELQSENEVFEKPSWLGEEVSHDGRYTNANLAKTPYKTW